MKRLIATAGLLALAAASPAAAAAQSLEGRWANAKRSVIVEVDRCGDAWCGTIDWASANNRKKGATPGTRVLTGLRAQGGGVYKGRAYEPKREISGSATVRQVGPNTMLVKGCAVIGLFCKEQRWTRIGS
jgi:uncharacterized protein (DUF2147 family)